MYSKEGKVMKKYLKSIIMIITVCMITSCSNITNNYLVESTIENTEMLETTNNSMVENEIKQSVNKNTYTNANFDSNIKFSYTGDDEYIKLITDDMLLQSLEHFGDDGFVMIPTPYIVKVDESNNDDIKVYGDFWVYGYTLDGTVFNMVNGGSFPGCYHLKNENGKIFVINREIAEDGSNNFTSLVKICGGDEDLAKRINSYRSEDDTDSERIKYVKMYAEKNNLKISGIKDYGWPIILFDELSDAEFVYNFYTAYFKVAKEEKEMNEMINGLKSTTGLFPGQEEIFNDMVEGTSNLKNIYMDEELIKKIDAQSIEKGIDAIINAKDVTDEMEDTLQVDDYGNGKLKVTYCLESENATQINIKTKIIDSHNTIVDINY